jgi:colanic acid biosynthesis glycosyl transferase WcaI
MPDLYFLNRYAWPDDSATAQLLTDLTIDQARRGRRPVVLTSRQLYREAKARLPGGEVSSEVHYIRLWSTAFGRDRLLGRALDYLSFYLSVFLHLLFRLPRGATLVSLTDPPLITLVTWLPCALRGVRQIHWSQDVFPEIVGALRPPARPVALGLESLRRLRNASLGRQVRIAAIGEDMRRHFEAQGTPPANLTVLPNWSSGDTVYPVPARENPLREAWGLREAFVLGYSGNLGRVHDYRTFLDAAERLVATIPSIRFLFIGSGALQTRLRAELPGALREHTLFQPYQERRLLSQSLSVPDVHWISLQPACTPFVFPSKFYGVIAAGRPCLFVGAPEAELARLLARERIGLAVAQGDGAAFAAAVEAFAGDRESLAAMGSRARLLFETHYDQPLALARWDALIGASVADPS